MFRGHSRYFPRILRLRGPLLFCLLGLLAQPATAQAVYRVTQHNGGPVAQMAQEVRDLAANRTEVRIGPGDCMSSCTMLLGAPVVCTYPQTRFGFHGPTSRYYGIGLPPEDFERWSRVMADHYPEPIRNWFLNTARHKLIGVYIVSGRELIAMGVPKCT